MGGIGIPCIILRARIKHNIYFHPTSINDIAVFQSTEHT